MNNFNAAVSKLNTLTRCFVSLPSWMCSQYTFQVVSKDPVKFFDRGLSDHAPCSWRMAIVGSENRQHQLIPSFISKSPEFKDSSARLVACANLDSLSKLERLEVHKEILYEAARIVRELLSDKKQACIDSQLMLLDYCARVAVRNNVTTAKSILARNVTSRGLLAIEGSSVIICDPPSFASSFAEAKCKVIERNRQGLSASMTALQFGSSLWKRKKSQYKALLRLAALWKNISPVSMYQTF